jgi:hypothetical protein
MSFGEISDLEMLKADIASRLRSACEHFCDEDFAELVHQIAQIELKYARRETAAPPTTDGGVCSLQQ